ncbi:PepSY domain-containing protein [Vagococcus lutrae]|uniref:PepSY domain-containing protein n=1 Tax=Vagococcus lutrae TaxID=81947 RepID=UPI002891D64C|nr:PepSY domain-containing protein [Vagococcus lutrae]MDT2801224.1 PepSY domain-containing protein [Vagococcus lutrae]
MKIKRILTSGLVVTLVAVLSGCQTKQAPTSTETSVTNQTKISETETSRETTSENLDLGQEITVSLDDVIALYQETYPDTHLTSIELEPERNQYIYKLEGVDEQEEYELKVDATTKEIKKQKNESLDHDERNGVKLKNKAIDLTNLASLNDVTETAKKEAVDYTPVEWELKQELGVTYWKVNLKQAHKEKEVKINAQDLSILKVEDDD